jgi:hypothetical protein
LQFGSVNRGRNLSKALEPRIALRLIQPGCDPLNRMPRRNLRLPPAQDVRACTRAFCQTDCKPLGSKSGESFLIHGLEWKRNLKARLRRSVDPASRPQRPLTLEFRAVALKADRPATRPDSTCLNGQGRGIVKTGAAGRTQGPGAFALKLAAMKLNPFPINKLRIMRRCREAHASQSIPGV